MRKRCQKKNLSGRKVSTGVKDARKFIAVTVPTVDKEEEIDTNYNSN